MIQQLIVGVIVAAALLHFCTKYLPAAWRERIVYWLARRGADQARMAALFKTQSSCGDGGCSSCGSCATPAASDAGAAAASTSSPDAAKRVIPLHVQR